ncbi:unnamed protein product [Brachionus calyciflorus]|uniref:Integrase catalytic domain-containing protein n=1 Tax=Brachionus calyciflorus TaxID=104777 RepID=A0A814FNW9_9BILA|nr:unnamed protein product [Brachionus calyciflorus]
MKNPNARLTRWSILLQTFDFEIIHRKGVLHSNVDALSRPVMIAEITDNNEEDLSTKYLDPYQDSHLLHFFKYNRNPERSSKKQVKRVSRLSKHFTLKEDTLYFRKFIKKCNVCIRFDKSKVIDHPALTLPIRSIFDRIGIDLVFGLPKTVDGYIGLLVIIEHVFAYPIKSKTAIEIAEKILEFISIFGPPSEFLSDRGPEFNPQTNGKTERVNQTIVSALKKQSSQDPENWNKYLPYVLIAYRTRNHSSTKFSPYEILFGRKMNAIRSWEIKNGEDDESALIRRTAEIQKLSEQFDKTEVIDNPQNIDKIEKILDHKKIGRGYKYFI